MEFEEVLEYSLFRIKNIDPMLELFKTSNTSCFPNITTPAAFIITPTDKIALPLSKIKSI